MTATVPRDAAVVDTRFEYRLAFDLAMAHLVTTRRDGETMLVVASAAPFVDEALLRIDGPLDVAVESQVPAQIARDRARVLVARGYGPATVMLAAHLAGPSEAKYRSVLWVCPERRSWRQRLHALTNVLMPGADVLIVTAGMFGCLLGPLRRARAVGEPEWLGPGLRRVLDRAGLRQKCALRIGGPMGAAWALQARLALLAGRPDLADRAEGRYRRALVAPGERGPAVVSLLRFRHEDAE
jgi:hypothetical protein